MFDTNKKRHRLRVIAPAYPAFNIYSFIADKTTALGPVCVASAVNEMPGWDVEVIDENNMRRYGPREPKGDVNHEFLETLRPADVVGFYGGLTSTIPRLYLLARYYKSKGAITIAGGQHFVDENIAEGLSSGLDYIVIGEGEETTRELLHAIERGEDVSGIKGIAYLKDGKVFLTPSRPPITDFDKLPIPDFSLERYSKIKIFPIERIRGCGMDCEFCAVKGKPRIASVERMLERISQLVETKDARHFFIVDDLFGQERDETVRFCRMLRDYQKKIGRRLDTTVQIRLDKSQDTELLSAMREAGINTVAIGFESPIDEELKAMNKHIKAQDMIAMTRVFHKYGFLIHGMFIFGYPLKDVSFSMPAVLRVKRFRDFITKARIDTVQVLLAGPLPGTELRRRLMAQNRVYPKADVGWEYYDGNFPLFEPDPPLTAEQMQDSALKIMGKFYRFRHMFRIGLNIFFFPSMVFFLHNIKAGWRIWYRSWRNDLIRFGGWLILKKWTTDFKASGFTQKLKNAKTRLKSS
ncbi:B12-binding domain-containing radical SAM protein [Candidatus Omnitrophota bacterium]